MSALSRSLFLSLAVFTPLATLSGCSSSEPKPISQSPTPIHSVINDEGTIVRPTFSTAPLEFRKWTIEETTVDALARIGQPAVAELILLLSESDATLRREAAQALARMGELAAPAVPTLKKQLENERDPAVRQQFIRALGQIGPAAESAVPQLIDELKDGLKKKS